MNDNNSKKHEKNAIVSVSGIKIKCDSCDYAEPFESVDEEMVIATYEKYLNAPCPKCGAPLLTQADFDLLKKVVAGVNALNQLATDAIKNGPTEKIHLSTDGKGNLKMSDESGNILFPTPTESLH